MLCWIGASGENVLDFFSCDKIPLILSRYLSELGQKHLYVAWKSFTKISLVITWTPACGRLGEKKEHKPALCGWVKWEREKSSSLAIFRQTTVQMWDTNRGEPGESQPRWRPWWPAIHFRRKLAVKGIWSALSSGSTCSNPVELTSCCHSIKWLLYGEQQIHQVEAAVPLLGFLLNTKIGFQ